MTARPGVAPAGSSGRGGDAVPVARVITLTVLVGAGYMFPLYLIGALGPVLRRDLELSPTQLGALVSVFFATGAPLLPFGGRLVDRMGPRRSIRVAVTGAATCLLAVAVLGGSHRGLLVAMAIGGLASAVAAPVGGMVIARTVPADRRPMAFAFERSSIPAATLLAGLCVPIVATWLPWRGVFAIAALLVLLVLLVRVPDIPAPVRAGDTDTRIRPLGPLLLVVLMFLLGSAAATAMSTFLVDYGVRVGTTAATAGLVLSATSAATIAVRLALGAVGHRAPGRALGTGLLVAGAGGFVLLALGGPVGFVLGAVLAGAAGWGWTGILGAAVVQSHPGAPGAVTALVQAGGCVGGIAGPLLFGQLIEGPGYGAAWLMLAGAALVAGGVAVGNRGIWHGVAAGTVDLADASHLSSERTAVVESGTTTGTVD